MNRTSEAKRKSRSWAVSNIMLCWWLRPTIHRKTSICLDCSPTKLDSSLSVRYGRITSKMVLAAQPLSRCRPQTSIDLAMGNSDNVLVSPRA